MESHAVGLYFVLHTRVTVLEGDASCSRECVVRASLTYAFCFEMEAHEKASRGT